jgi:hypothetical protein
MYRMLFFLLACVLAQPCIMVDARADVTVAPTQRTTVMGNGTIATGNTFQSIMAADLNRTGCIIQNTSTHTMYVYFGATASATTSNTFQVPAGGFIYCGAGGSGVVALTDNVAITTSTTSDTFVFAFQH